MGYVTCARYEKGNFTCPDSSHETVGLHAKSTGVVLRQLVLRTRLELPVAATRNVVSELLAVFNERRTAGGVVFKGAAVAVVDAIALEEDRVRAIAAFGCGGFNHRDGAVADRDGAVARGNGVALGG